MQHVENGMHFIIPALITLCVMWIGGGASATTILSSCVFSNTSLQVADNCTGTIVATNPNNIQIEMRGVLVPLMLTGDIFNVTIIVRDIFRAADDPLSWGDVGALIVVQGTQVTSVTVLIANVTLLNTSLALVTLTSAVVGAGLRDVKVFLSQCEIHLFAAPLRRYLIGVDSTSSYNNITIGIIGSCLSMQWEKDRFADSICLGLVYLGQMVVQGTSRGFTLHVNDTNVTHSVTTVPEAVTSTRASPYFGILVLNQPSATINVSLITADVLFWRLRLQAEDTEIAHVSMSVVTTFSSVDKSFFTTVGWRMRVMQSFLNITGQDSSVVFMWTAGTTIAAYLEISTSEVHLLRRGLGSMTKLACESSLIKTDNVNTVNTTVVMHDVWGTSVAAAGDSTNSSVVDASAGSSASLVHLGQMSYVSVIIQRVVFEIGISFGYVSKKDQLNINAFCASAVLLDSAILVLIFASNFTLQDSSITASSIFSYSSVFDGLKNFMMYLNNVGLFTVSISLVSSRCVASNVSFLTAGVVTPILTATETSFDFTVAFAVTQTGLWCMGGKPSDNRTKSQSADNYDNEIVFERLTFQNDAAAAQARWDAMPAASRAITIRQASIGVVTLIGNQTNNKFTLSSVESQTSGFMLHALVLVGAQPLPTYLQSLPPVAEALAGFSTTTQLFNSTCIIDSSTFINGSLVALVYSQPMSLTSELPTRLLVTNSTFVSPAVSQYGTGALTRLFTTVTKPFSRLDVQITDSHFFGYQSVINQQSVNWTNMAHQHFDDDRFDFRCVTLNGTALTKQGSGVPSHWLLRPRGVPHGCRVEVSATITESVTRELQVPLPPRTLRPDLGMSPYLTAATAIASVVSPLTGILMQRSVAALVLIGCDASIADPPAASDSPLQLQLGNITSGGYVRGAVVGNIVFLACACVLGMLIGLFSTRGERHALSATAWFVHGARAVGLPGLALAPLSLLLQPTVTMSVLSLSALGGGGDVVLGLIGLTVYIVPCVYLGWMTTARLMCIAIPELSTKRRRGQEAQPSRIPIVVEVLVAERVKWVSQRRETRVYYRHFGAVFEGYVGGRTWFVWIEMGTGLAYGVLTGFEPSTDAGCRAQLWVNFVLSVAILASAALWPYNGLLWNLNYALNGAVMMAVAVLMVLEDDDASGVVAMVAAWVAVAFTLFDTTLRAVVGGLANALRRLVGLIPRDTTLWNGTFVPLTNVPLKLQKSGKRSEALGERSISDVFVSDRRWHQQSSTTKAQVRALRDLIELIAKDRKLLCVEEEWVA